MQPNHKIFLSHSGAQKDFVEELCGDLERHYHFPFFDRRPSCLPKGDRFPELILKAPQQCEMAVVVVSKDYFTSKWPMIEYFCANKVDARGAEVEYTTPIPLTP